MKLKHLIWLGPIVFLIHDLEEVFFMQMWLDQNDHIVEASPFIQHAEKNLGYTPLEFGIVVVFMTFIFFVIAYFTAKQPTPGVAMNFFIAGIQILFINFFTHLGQSILLNMYTPGLITASLIVLPYTLVVFHQLKKAQILAKISWIAVTSFAVFLLFVLFGSMYVIRIIFNLL